MNIQFCGSLAGSQFKVPVDLQGLENVPPGQYELPRLPGYVEFGRTFFTWWPDCPGFPGLIFDRTIPGLKRKMQLCIEAFPIKGGL